MPDDISYVSGTTGNELLWKMSTPTPDSYIIYQNNVDIDQGIWTTGVPISINVDGLNLGTYNYTIYANNTNGDFNVDTAYVNVTDLPKWIIKATNTTIT